MLMAETKPSVSSPGAIIEAFDGLGYVTDEELAEMFAFASRSFPVIVDVLCH